MLKRILGNTIWITLGQGIGKAVAFLLMIFIARYLGDALYGQFSFALSLVSIMVVVVDFGFGTLATREIARNKDLTQKYLGNVVAVKTLLGLITFGLIYIILLILNKDELTTQLTMIAGAYIIINSFEQFFYTIFRAREKMKFEAITKLVYNISLFIIGLLFIQQALSAQWIMSAYLFAALISLVVSLGFIWKYFSKFKIEFDAGFIKDTLKQSWPFALSSVFIILYLKIDTVMLSQMRTDQEVGWYNAAYNIVFALLIMPTIFDTIFYPILSKTFHKKKEFVDVCKKMFLYAFVLAFPAGIVVYFLRKQIIELVYSNEYNMAIPILGILVWSFVLAFINRFPFIINAANRQILITKQIGFGVAFNIIMNLILIPKYGTLGAAWATVLTEVIAVILLSYYALIKYKKQIFYEN